MYILNFQSPFLRGVDDNLDLTQGNAELDALEDEAEVLCYQRHCHMKMCN